MVLVKYFKLLRRSYTPLALVFWQVTGQQR